MEREESTDDSYFEFESDKMVVPFREAGKSEEELVSGVDVSVAFGGRIIHLITN